MHEIDVLLLFADLRHGWVEGDDVLRARIRREIYSFLKNWVEWEDTSETAIS